MRDDLLTIVTPTRDRPDLLALCLRSVFEAQRYTPPVIVSDNSTREHAAIAVLRERYRFTYVRQSGLLPIVEHQNACLRMPSSRWVLLLHDDDELGPGSLEGLLDLLAERPAAGIVMAGTQAIDFEGRMTAQWLPAQRTTVRGDEALLALGLDWGLRAPGTIYGVRESQELGGLPDVLGLPADYAHAAALAYRFGIAFLPVPVGRQREGHDRATTFDTPAKALRWLTFTSQQAALVRTLGGAPAVADRLVDYLVWSTFEALAPWWTGFDRAAVADLVQTCRRYSPGRGDRQDRVRHAYPFLFWRPQHLSWLLYRIQQDPYPLRRLVRALKRKYLTRL
jgi:glycosyl transferase family 2